MNSLRTRLLLWLLGAVLLTGVAGAAFLYRQALAEADIVFDQQLQETAHALRDRSFLQPAPEFGEREAAADLVVQVWSLTGVRVYLSQRHASLPGLTTLGFSTVRTPEGEWRVYGLRTPFNVIQVAQPMRVRESRAAHLAARVLLPLLLLMPALGMVIWISVGRVLAPLRKLAQQVGSRPAIESAPLREQGLPAEVQPLVASLNDLLGRLSSQREGERRFIADAAHELRTPLTALRLQLRGLAQAGEQERRAAIEALESGVGRASRLVEQMLALARQDAPEPEAGSEFRRPLVLAELARQVIGELYAAAEAKQVDLGLDDAASEARLVGEPEALKTLLRNLLDNAIRHSPQGGRIDVSVRSAGSTIELVVLDQGPGIPEAERGRVFDRFYRAPDAPPGGSGLGLAIVRSIAESHSATVTLAGGGDGRGLKVVVRFSISGGSI